MLVALFCARHTHTCFRISEMVVITTVTVLAVVAVVTM